MVPSQDRETGASWGLIKYERSMRWLLVDYLVDGRFAFARARAAQSMTDAKTRQGRDSRLVGWTRGGKRESRCGGRGLMMEACLELPKAQDIASSVSVTGSHPGASVRPCIHHRFVFLCRVWSGLLWRFASLSSHTNTIDAHETNTRHDPIFRQPNNNCIGVRYPCFVLYYMGLKQ